MDAIAKQGVVGVANHTPENLPAGSSVANMSLLGYDPQVNYTGRAPIEAAAQGIELADEDWCIRCNSSVAKKRKHCSRRLRKKSTTIALSSSPALVTATC